MWSVVRRSLQVNIVVVRRSNKWWGRRGRLGGLRCLLQSEVGQLTVAILRQVNVLVQVAVSKIGMVQVPRDEARRVLGVRWSRKPEVTDFKADRRVVWQCVQVKNSSDYF